MIVGFYETIIVVLVRLKYQECFSYIYTSIKRLNEIYFHTRNINQCYLSYLKL